ncbi:hypothetical protein [Synechococcus sp. WH 8016]|jgi:hypothetical protein|uniref:hypothetical protein n=1 Tax=Synechococcus sp. WH 8016 TaxID=166318 RepID=UPI00022D90FD|nr:hypothetical protein [Synechococcus sp. WH 8016]EHA59084.1 hypothetical protein Syn8016DRAFT_2807 [Synechococcus sp. WH 8016]NKB74557.1 hypothetical protein [Synechococcus sp. s2_metabat2_7]
MAHQDSSYCSPPPVWKAARPPSGDVEALKARVNELEQQVRDYETLLSELPDLFERKFQQRLEPLLERYRLLAQAQQLMAGPAEAEIVPLPLRADRQGQQQRNIAA